MALKIYISSRQTPEYAVVSTVDKPINARLPALVFADSYPAEIYIVDGAGGYDAISGAAGYSVKAAIGNRGEVPTGGTFTLTFDGDTTAAIDYDATTSELQSALEGLSSIGSGNVTVTGLAGAWQVEFIGALAETDCELLAGDAALLTPIAAVNVVELQSGGTGVNATQFIYLTQTPGWISASWTAITNGWSGVISTARPGILSLFTDKTKPVQTYFEIEITDPSGYVRTYCSAPVVILPQVIDVNSIVGNTLVADVLTDMLAAYQLKIEANANFRFKNGQLQIWDTAVSAWRALGNSGGSTVWSEPIAD